jgi:protein-S-isoprenylcysteine O-methyltransferase Ste14
MALREEFVKAGNVLFRWRSYLPLLGFGLLLIGLKDYEYPGGSRRMDQIWDLSCLLLSFLGLGIRALALGFVPGGTSGRNTKNQIAEMLNTTGMYSIVRHPLYLGNAFICIGILLSIRSWWVTLVFLMIYWLYYERIMFAEEEFLRSKFSDAFVEWSEKTPAFLPKFKNWRSSGLPFSFKNVLKREYPCFFGIIASFVLLEIAEARIVEGKFGLDLIWIVIFAVGLITYITLRTLKRKTKILNVEGR